MDTDRVPERTGMLRQKRFQPPTVPDSFRMIGFPDVLKHPAELRCLRRCHVRMWEAGCQVILLVNHSVGSRLRSIQCLSAAAPLSSAQESHAIAAVTRAVTALPFCSGRTPAGLVDSMWIVEDVRAWSIARDPSNPRPPPLRQSAPARPRHPRSK
jgi:hypothetical protein